MFGSKLLRNLTGEAALVEVGRVFVADGEGVDVSRPVLGHQRHHRARVDAAGQEGADGDVAHAAPRHRARDEAAGFA